MCEDELESRVAAGKQLILKTVAQVHTKVIRAGIRQVAMSVSPTVTAALLHIYHAFHTTVPFAPVIILFGKDHIAENCKLILTKCE